MPSKSPAQAKLMRAVAHGWKKPGGGPSRSVAREFMNADQKAKGYGLGGFMKFLKPPGLSPTENPFGGGRGIAATMERGLAELRAKQEDPVAWFENIYGSEPITGKKAKKLSGKEGIAGGLKAMTDLAQAGWTSGVGGEDIDFEDATWYPPEDVLGSERESTLGPAGPSGLSGPAREGSIAEMLMTKYGIVDPTSTDYDKYYDPADPYAHLPQQEQRQNEMWEAARVPVPAAPVRERVSASDRYPLSRDVVGQLRAHKSRIADILRPKEEEEEPVEMQYGGRAGGLGQFARRAGGFPGGGGGMPQQLRQRMMQQGRGRGRGRGFPGRGGRGFPGGRRGMPPQMPGGAMKSLGRPQPGGMPPVQPGGPGGMVPGRQMLGATGPGGAGMPGANAPPSLRGHLQKQQAMQRQTAGGNRVGMRDQQGGLARAMQTQTGRPPISRRAAFPGSRQNQY